MKVIRLDVYGEHYYVKSLTEETSLLTKDIDKAKRYYNNDVNKFNPLNSSFLSDLHYYRLYYGKSTEVVEVYSNIEKIRLAALHVSKNLSHQDSEDLRYVDNKRRTSYIESMIRYEDFDISNKIFQKYLRDYAKVSFTWLQKIYKEQIRSKGYKAVRNYHPTFAVCCGSCHTGTSDTRKLEIESQRIKYDNVYICKRCEKIADNIDNYDLELFTGTGVYKNEGIADPSRSMLGFAGACYIIKKIDGSIIITNNLFSKISISKLFYDKVKHRINCTMYYVPNFKTEHLETVLSIDEIHTISDQLKKAKKLGHKIDYDPKDYPKHSKVKTLASGEKQIVR